MRSLFIIRQSRDDRIRGGDDNILPASTIDRDLSRFVFLKVFLIGRWLDAGFEIIGATVTVNRQSSPRFDADIKDIRIAIPIEL